MLKILRLTARKVHGYIPMDLSFNDDLTFLTGSNGCGKTTAIKLISALLQPDFEQINQIIFENVKLDFVYKEDYISISLSKVENNQNVDWVISTSFPKNDPREAITSQGIFKLYPTNDEYPYSTEEFSKLRESIRIQFFESEFFKKVDSFGSPIILGIDRKIVGKIYDKPIFRRRNERHFLHDISDVSYFHAQNELIEYVSSNADRKKNLIESFKANIFRTLFRYLNFETKNEGYAFLDKKQLRKKKELTISAVKGLELGDSILEEIENYFSNIESLQKSLEDKSIEGERRQIIYNEWWANRPHLSRIELVSEYAEKYQKEIDKLDFPLLEITNIANSFFEESHKYLNIGANGRIHVKWKDQNITSSNLSSGEIQLIVIIIHLVFCEIQKSHSVFVIDEPELSLHLSWQEKFVDAILKASPGTQFILATHSPAIISKLEYENKCITMKNV